MLGFSFAGHELPRGYAASTCALLGPTGSRRRILAEKDPQLQGDAGEGPAGSWEAQGKVSAIFFSHVGTPSFKAPR